MNSSIRSSILVGSSAAAAGLILVIAACQNTSGTGSTTSGSTGTGGNGSGGSSPTSFSPKGCGFQIAPRPEYKSFEAGSGKSAAAPNIRRVRLGLGGNVQPGAAGHADPSTSAGFAWQTDDGTTASEVAWGADPDPTKWDAANRVSGVTWLTPRGDLNGVEDERMHEAYVCGLKPATSYYYRVGGGASGSEAWSDVYAFATTPSDAGAKITIGLTGDSRGEQNNAWQILQQHMFTAGVTLQMFSGDMINLAPDQGEWEQWLDSAWKDSNGKYLTLAQTLMLSAHGNHDNHTSLFFGNMVLPQDLTAYPKYGELFFSADVGAAHLVVVDDAFIVNPDGDADYKPALDTWLNADLAAANQNRAKVPWIVVMHHHPEFSSSLHGKDVDVLRGRNYFVPIWDKYHVDLAIAGHDHDYERSKPLTGPADSPTVHASFADGTVYLVCAGSGADGYGAATSNFSEISHDYKNGGALGLYSILTVDKTSLVLEAHELRGDASDPVFDTMTITKP
jgi:hypothetical protein